MKSIYSVLAIATITLGSTLTFTSCEKSDDISDITKQQSESKQDDQLINNNKENPLAVDNIDGLWYIDVNKSRIDDVLPNCFVTLNVKNGVANCSISKIDGSADSANYEGDVSFDKETGEGEIYLNGCKEISKIKFMAIHSIIDPTRTENDESHELTSEDFDRLQISSTDQTMIACLYTDCGDISVATFCNIPGNNNTEEATSRAYLAKGTYNTNSLYVNGHTIKTNEWMKYIDNEQYVGCMTIPGSHDSTTKGVTLGSDYGQVQTLSLEEQFDAGIRHFDIRVAANGFCYHDCMPCNIRFSEVMHTFSSLLYNHPSEGILVSISYEGNAIKSKARDITTDILTVVFMGDERCATEVGKIYNVATDWAEESIYELGTTVSNGCNKALDAIKNTASKVTSWFGGLFRSANYNYEKNPFLATKEAMTSTITDNNKSQYRKNVQSILGQYKYRIIDFSQNMKMKDFRGKMIIECEGVSDYTKFGASDNAAGVGTIRSPKCDCKYRYQSIYSFGDDEPIKMKQDAFVNVLDEVAFKNDSILKTPNNEEDIWWSRNTISGYYKSSGVSAFAGQVAKTLTPSSTNGYYQPKTFAIDMHSFVNTLLEEKKHKFSGIIDMDYVPGIKHNIASKLIGTNTFDESLF